MRGKIFRLLFFGESLYRRVELVLKGVKPFVRALYLHPKNARRKIVRKKSNAFRPQRHRRRRGANDARRFRQCAHVTGRDIAEKF